MFPERCELSSLLHKGTPHFNVVLSNASERGTENQDLHRSDRKTIPDIFNVYINQRDSQILVNNLYFSLNGSTCFGLSLVRNM